MRLHWKDCLESDEVKEVIKKLNEITDKIIEDNKKNSLFLSDVLVQNEKLIKENKSLKNQLKEGWRTSNLQFDVKPIRIPDLKPEDWITSTDILTTGTTLESDFSFKIDSEIEKKKMSNEAKRRRQTDPKPIPTQGLPRTDS